MTSRGVDEALRAQAVGPGVPVGGARQDATPHTRPPRDVGCRAREAGAGAARHDLAAAEEGGAAAHGGREAIRALHLDPGHLAAARMAETGRGHARAIPTPHNQCSQAPKTRMGRAMDPQKALCHRTRSHFSHRRLLQARTPIQTFPRGQHHLNRSLAGSTRGMPLSLLRHLRRIIKANGLLHLHHPWQATTVHNSHLRAGFRQSRARLPRASGAAVGRLRLRLSLPRDIQNSTSSHNQEDSNMAGAGTAAAVTVAGAAGTTGAEDGDRS